MTTPTSPTAAVKLLREALEYYDCSKNNERANRTREALRLTASIEQPTSEARELALNTRHDFAHKAADAFWKYWKENGETHKHGYYESTWGAINRAIRMVGVVPHDYGNPAPPALPAKPAEAKS